MALGLQSMMTGAAVWQGKATNRMPARDKNDRGCLYKLEVTNFKSYAGNLTIGPFKDFTCVIGPNGSGAVIFCAPCLCSMCLCSDTCVRHAVPGSAAPVSVLATHARIAL